MNYKFNLIPSSNQIVDRNQAPVAEQFDWRSMGAVSEVRNGSTAASDAILAVVEALEGQVAISRGVLVRLSTQQAAECMPSNETTNIKSVHNYFMRSGGIESESDYPPAGEAGRCRFDRGKSVAEQKGFLSITPGDEKTLKELVFSKGPFLAMIDSKMKQFREYVSGIFDEAFCDKKFVNHAVLIVGYGREDDREFWIVKNNWGTGWGEGGYIRIAMNKRNICGIATAATLPLLDV